MTLVQEAARPGPTRARARRLALPGAVVAAAALGSTYVAAVDPNQAGHYPVCPTYALAGVYCPGCGMLRATHDLAHLDLVGAFARNPLALPIYLGIAWLFVRWVTARWRGEQLRWDPPTWLPAVLAVAFVAYTVARNIPGWTWLSPA
ncbi:MAG TPA: DUF2752 domain-containing protein [Ornithinibacter sp.]|nr:DUF2752 domain-containing protein [Ornithinibacter sp.]